MRRTCTWTRALWWLACLCVLPVASADVDVRFDTPATFAGDLHVDHAGWILVLFPDGGGWSASAQPEGVWDVVEYRYVGAERPRRTGGDEFLAETWTDVRHHAPRDASMSLDPGDAWSSVYVEADRVRLTGTTREARLDHLEESLAPRWLPSGPSIPRQAFRRQGTEPAGTALLDLDAGLTDLRLEVDGLRILETRGARVGCMPSCTDAPLLPGTDGRLATASSLRWEAGNGTMRLRADHALVVLGGAGLRVATAGAVRLPGLHVDGLDGGVAADGETLRARGTMVLHGVRTERGGHGWASLDATLTQASLDEREVPMGAAATVSVASTALLVLLAWKGKALASLLAGLFSRLDAESALEHPNRRRIYDYIEENRGPSFRELMRVTGLAAGTVRHHLNVLVRCEAVVEREHGHTMRFFDAVRDGVDDWEAVVVRRNPDLARMHDWLMDNPDVMQRDVLDEAESWGWSRSTAQHRLKRLVDEGLAEARSLGRQKTYRARVAGV